MAGTLVSSSSFSAHKGVGAGVQCFQLTYQSLEGYANLLSRKTEVGGTYHVRKPLTANANAALVPA